MKHSKLLLLVLALFLSFSLVACQSAAPQTPADAATPEAGSPEAAPVQKPTKDRAGFDIRVPADVQTIISFAPSMTQVIVDLGLKDKLVALDTQSPLYAPGLEALPQFDMLAPDMEALAALKPDVMFVSGMSSESSDDPFKPLKELGIAVVTIPSSGSIDDIKRDNQFIADVLGESEKGIALNAAFQAKIDEIKAIGQTIADKKSVLFEIATLPDIYSFGTGTFLHEMLLIIGAENVMADQTSWLKVTEEQAISRNPDVILTNVNYVENAVDDVLGRTGWNEVTAIKNKAVYYIDNGNSSLPNHNIVKALVEMAKAVYPESFKDLK